MQTFPSHALASSVSHIGGKKLQGLAGLGSQGEPA